MALAFALCVFGCGEQKIEEAHDLVQRKLGDSNTVEFAEVALSQHDPAVVCGLIVSKDGFLDHTRMKRFFADLKANEAHIDPHAALLPQARVKVDAHGTTEVAEFESLYREVC